MSNKNHILFPVKFPEQLETWMKQQKKLGKPGTQYNFAKQVGVDPSYVSDWKSGRQGIPHSFIPAICKVLGVSSNVYEPKTHDEKYKYAPDFISSIGKEHVNFANHIGLKLEFVESLSEIMGTDEYNQTFPIYTEISTRKISPQGIEYSRSENADSAPIDKDLQFLQINRNGKRITLHRADLAFLKEVQDQVSEFVKYLFYKRSREMKNEVVRFNEGLRMTLKDGGEATKQPTKEYTLSIDRFAKYNYED